MIKIKTITKIGSVVLFLFSSFFVVAEMTVKMSVLDSNGHKLEQVQIGKPFVLDVYVSGAQGNVEDPQIEGVQDFAVHNTACHVNNLNGNMLMRYSYTARIDMQGSYSIGPAIVRDDKESAQSDLLIIKAGNEEIVQSGSKVTKRRKEVLLLIQADQQEYIVGQKIEGTISFLFLKKIDRLFSVSGPDLKGFTIKHDSMLEGVIEFDGKQYSSATWDWHMFSKQPGTLVIPSCSADFSMKRGRNFSFFLNFQPERRRVYSNVLTVNVQSLPPHTEPVDAVGMFQNFEIGLNQVSAKEGDGIVVELSIEGEADLENLNLELQNIPHVFKSYSSKQKIVESQEGGMQKKSFEYIIQGMEAGEWEIPEQKFTYYDTKSFSYKTLRTASLLVKILPQSSTRTYTPPPIQNSLVATSLDTQHEVRVDDLPLNTSGRWYEIPERKMSWWLFMLLFFAPLMIWFSVVVRRFLHYYSEQRAPQVRWRNAFKIAHKKIERAKKQEDFPALYRIFVELYATRCSIKKPLLSEEKIESILQEQGVSQELINEWAKFFADLSAFIFYTVHSSDEQKKLFDQADRWVLILKEVI